MGIKFCETCKGIIWTGAAKGSREHRCPPEWKCAVEEWEGDDVDSWKKIYASSDRQAAEKYADWHDSYFADYEFMENSIEVAVVSESGEKTVFDVGGESVREYTAYEKEEK